MRYVFLLSYDGTHFAGWQKQTNARTVQGVLERVAPAIFKDGVKITGSGRTDAGVHALGQVCQLDGETNVPAERLRECFNRILPPDVRILRSARAPDGFDCTRAKKAKTYVYRAYFAESELPLSERFEARLEQQPDLAAMQRACRLVVGEHDFAAFRATGSSAKTTVRTVHSLVCRMREEAGAAHYEIEVCGNGFLYNMVRILAGELFRIGCGKGTDALERALVTGERSLLAKTMPAKGLTLLKTEYETPVFGEE